jgi:hypothetical protein
VKVRGTSAKKSSKTSSVKAKRTVTAAPKRSAKKAEQFAGTAKGTVDRPAAQLPRSGWKDTEAFRASARAARDRVGAPGEVATRPEIRPLYGLPMQIPLPKLSDRGLRDAAKDILRDRRINVTEVDALIRAAGDNGGLSKTEKRDLKRLMSEVGEHFDIAALRQLQFFVDNDVGPRPDIRPMYGLPVPVPFPIELRNQKLNDALRTMLGDRKITPAEVDALIAVAVQNGGVSKTERADLLKLLREGAAFMAPAAHAKLERFLGVGIPPDPSPVIRPLYGLPFAFPGPQVSTMGPMGMGPGVLPASSRPTVELAHAQAFVAAATHNGGLSSMDKSEMRALLAGGAVFSAQARTVMDDFMRTQ